MVRHRQDSECCPPGHDRRHLRRPLPRRRRLARGERTRRRLHLLYRPNHFLAALDRRALPRRPVPPRRPAGRDFRILSGRRGFRLALRGAKNRRPLRAGRTGVAPRQRNPGALAPRNRAPDGTQPTPADRTPLSRPAAAWLALARSGGALAVGRGSVPARRGLGLAAREVAGPLWFFGRPPGFSTTRFRTTGTIDARERTHHPRDSTGHGLRCVLEVVFSSDRRWGKVTHVRYRHYHRHL